MDRTEEILKLFNSHLRIKNFLTILCYFSIIGGLFIYVFYAFNQNKNVKLVNKFKDNKQEYKTEKIMTNPRIKFQYSDDQIYNIKAKKAFHKDEQEVILYDVFATGDIGNITAGELKIDEEGNHLVFTKNPILILKKTGKEKSKTKKNEQ
jgi:hypothetical protein